MPAAGTIQGFFRISATSVDLRRLLGNIGVVSRPSEHRLGSGDNSGQSFSSFVLSYTYNIGTLVIFAGTLRPFVFSVLARAPWSLSFLTLARS